MRQKLGCWTHERWRAEVVLELPWLAKWLGLTWVDLCNRHENLDSDPTTGARIPMWSGSSTLTVSRVFPRVGQRLLQHCLSRWPIRFNESSEVVTSREPSISVIVPVGGTERLPQFQACLAALRAQEGVRFEVIVVEQSGVAAYRDLIPGDVRYRHTLLPATMAGFNKSWALNVGARMARGEYVVVLDADFVVPVDFLAACLRLVNGRAAARPARLIFCLDQGTSTKVIRDGEVRSGTAGMEILQNAPNPMVVDRKIYWSAGGHDESFSGWGGEDDEFLDRLHLWDVLDGGCVPIIHLWHTPAPKRADGSRNRATHEAVMRESSEKRVARLTSRNMGGSEPQPGSAASHESTCQDPSRQAQGVTE